MKAGISSYTYAWAIGVPGNMPDKPMTVFQLLDKAAELGVDVVQIADNLPLHRLSYGELIKIRDFAKDLHIGIEVGGRGMTVSKLRQYIRLADILNSPLVRFVIDEKPYQPDINQIHAIINNAIPELERNRVVLAIENHDRFRAEQYAEMVTQAGSTFVGICLDSVNSMGAGEGLTAVIGELAPLTVNLHVKEFSVKRVFHQMGFVIEGCPLGEGMLPLKDLVEKVKARCRSAILEQWTPPEQSIQQTIEKESLWAEKSIIYLKKTLKYSRI
jgi:sugar phosphate isomerase/epimerase